MKVDESMASALGCSLSSHAPQGVCHLTWPPDPLVLLCSLWESLLAWLCCYSNQKMETKLWREESVGGALKLLMPLVLMQQVPVKVSLISSAVPIALISSAPETLQSRISLTCPKQAECQGNILIATLSFSQACGCGEANTLCCFHSGKLRKLVEIGPI